eukprot:CCRYP_001468-RA/>CCRYP_001468-RA protein AED:0.34 eAED:0.34 QI:0/-1/0/1/-1/1/1/0/234
MKLAILSTLLATASAFAPGQQGPSITALAATRAVSKAAPKKEAAAPKKAAAAPKKAAAVKKPAAQAPPGLVGALPPVGFFDPAGFAAKASPEELSRYREVEIMHGRFAQLAVLGFIIPEKCAYDGSFGDDFLAPTGRALEVFNTDPLWLGLTLAVISALETVRLIETEPGTRTDAKIESLGWRPKTESEYINYQVRELQQGRLAMLAFAGEVAQELVNDKPLLVNLQDSGFVSW